MKVKKDASFEEYKKAVGTDQVFMGMARISQKDATGENDMLILDLGVAKGIIAFDELDGMHQWKSLATLVGSSQAFTVLSVDEDAKVVYGSRKKAQEILKPAFIKDFEEKKTFTGHITTVQKYGAYVQVMGAFTGLMKNKNFSKDHTTVREVKRSGDQIRVKGVNFTPNGNINFQAETLHSSPTALSFQSFEVDQVVAGSVKTVQPDSVFVNIAPGLDAKCPYPDLGGVQEGDRVQIRITQKLEDEMRIRGKVINL